MKRFFLKEKKKLTTFDLTMLGVGAMVSGGIYAVLGVGMVICAHGILFAYLIGAILVVITGRSYVRLTSYLHEGGGCFTFAARALNAPTFSRYIGWTILVGYVGTMAMYAYALGSYTTGLFGHQGDVLIRISISIAAVLFIMVINLFGLRSTTLYENVFVILKVVILLAAALIGIALFRGDADFISWIPELGWFSPFLAIGMVFISFEGFQLITYEYDDMKTPQRQASKSIYWTIIIGVSIYLLIPFMTTLWISPAEAGASEEYALAFAVEKFFGPLGALVIILSAIFSTSTGINATLFGTARLAVKMSTKHALPRFFGKKDRKGTPVWAVMLLTAMTIALTTFSTLEGVTAFASLAFLVIFAVVNFAACKKSKEMGISPILPLVGSVSCIGLIPILLYELYNREPYSMLAALAIFAVLIILETVLTVVANFNGKREEREASLAANHQEGDSNRKNDKS